MGRGRDGGPVGAGVQPDQPLQDDVQVAGGQLVARGGALEDLLEPGQVLAERRVGRERLLPALGRRRSRRAPGGA